MHARPRIAIFACTAALCAVLVGCGGSPATTPGGSGSGSAGATSASEHSAAATPSFSPDSLTLDDFDIKIESASVEYDEEGAKDALVFTIKATNNAEQALALGGSLNMADVSQGGQDLYWSYGIGGKEPGFNTAAAVGSGAKLEPGASAEYAYAFLLDGYDEPVKVNFDGYTSATRGGGVVTFDVSDCESEESKAAAQNGADDADADA